MHQKNNHLIYINGIIRSMINRHFFCHANLSCDQPVVNGEGKRSAMENYRITPNHWPRILDSQNLLQHCNCKSGCYFTAIQDD